MVLLAGNLRGVRQAGMLFAAPTYLFIFAMFVLVAVGLVDSAHHGFQATPRPPLTATEAVGALFVLRAFASGSTAMTGIEAISNAVPVFKPVEWRNARTTLTWMVGLLIVLFAGTIAMVQLEGIVPSAHETVLSEIAHRSFGSGFTAGITKFAAGAWVSLLAVGLVILLATAIRRHYETVARAIALHPHAIELPRHPIAPNARDALAGVAPADAERRHAAALRARKQGGETEETPEEIHHLILVAVASLDLTSMRALAYAASLQQPVLALHVSPTAEEAERFRDYWRTWGDHLPLEVVVSPYRAIVAPMISYIESRHQQRPDLTLTVILPEIIVRRPWQRILHNRIAPRLRRALRPIPKIVVTTVPFHLPS